MPQTNNPVDPADLGNPAHYEPHVAEGPRGQQEETPPAGRLRDPEGRYLPDPGHPASLMEEARGLGWTDEDLASVDTSSLATALRKSYNAILTDRDRRDTQRVLEQPARQPAPPVPPEEESLELPTAADGYDPKVTNLAALAKKLRDENKELKGMVAGLAERETQRVNRSGEETMDLAFEAMGEDWHNVVGKGDARDFKDKPELRRRLALLREAGVDLANLSTLPGPQKLKSLLIRAAEVLYPRGSAPSNKADLGAYGNVPAQPSNANGRGRPTEDDWRQGTLARATHRRGAAEPTGEALAVRNLTQKMQQAEHQGDTEILDSLLDAPRR